MITLTILNSLIVDGSIYVDILNGSKQVDYSNSEVTRVVVSDISQDVFKQLVSDGVEIYDAMCWLEVDKTLLDNHNQIAKDVDSLLRNYVLTYLESEILSTALILASHVGVGIGNNRLMGTDNDELISFITTFGNLDMSNVYIEKSAVNDKKLEYITQ